VVRDLLVRWAAGREVGADAGRAVLRSSFVSREFLALAIDVLVGRFLGAGDGVGGDVDVDVDDEEEAGDELGEIDIGCLDVNVDLEGSPTSLLGAFV
jgi:hypothetical protein